MAAFHGKPPGGSAGEMSRRTERLRPAIGLNPKEVREARRLRRTGAEPADIAATLAAPLEEIEKASCKCAPPARKPPAAP